MERRTTTKYIGGIYIVNMGDWWFNPINPRIYLTNLDIDLGSGLFDLTEFNHNC